MGDFTFFVPPATTTATPEAAAAPQPSAAAAAGRAAPRCRRHVHFPDFPSSTFWLPPPPAADDEAMAEEAEPEKEEATGGEVEEDRMDLLWEDFNEELLAMRGPATETTTSSSDGDYSDSAGRAPAAAGCFPVLRSSARAGGAGHYYYRRRRRAGTWALLMKIFRRLFVIDKTIVSGSATAARRHSTGS